MSTPISIKRHILKLPHRTGTCEVTEHTDKVVIRLRWDKYGGFDDMRKVAAWLGPIFESYDSDPRPVLMAYHEGKPVERSINANFDRIPFPELLKRLNSCDAYKALEESSEKPAAAKEITPPCGSLR
jgi:hypothetical protein